MALQVWLPLTKNLSNQGLNNMTFSIDAGSNIILDNNGKIGACYSRSTKQTSGRIVSNSTINLSEDISMACWALVSDCVGDTANGLISNHSHANNTGVGITVKQVSTSDYRISCNTGTGSNRTYCTYYGTTNIKGAWHHLALTYSKSAKQLILYVDGNTEYTLNNYVNSSIADYIIIFDWSTTFSGTSYRPAAKLNDVRIYDHCLSPKEVKEISKGLVLHYPLNDAYIEGTSNLFSTDLTYHTNWNNSGSATWNWNDNTIPKINNSIIYSISRIDTGNSAIGCGRCNLVAGKTYTASVYVYLSGNTDSNIFYVRSVDTNVSTLKYNNDVDPRKWPQNQWIRAISTFTPSAAYNNCYICTYLNNANSKRALTCWQIEEKDHVTPYTPNTRNEITVYDCSGYQNNGTIEEFKAAGNNLVTGLAAGGQTTVSGETVTTSGVNADTYFTINLSESIVVGQTYTLSCIGKNIPTNGYFGFPLGWQGNTSLIFNIKNGYNEITFTANDGSWGTNYLFMDDYDRGTAYMNKCEFTNFKLYKHSIVNSGLNTILDSPRYKIGAKFNGQHSIWLSSPLESGAKEELTVSFWHKPNSQGNYRTIVSNNYPHSGFWIGCNCEGYGLWYYGGSFYVRSQSPLPNDVWYHCVLTYKNQTYQWYLNGVPVTTSIYGTFKAPTFSSSISIGGNTNGDMKGGSSDYRQYGALSDFRIYSTALSADDIKELYNTSAYILDNGTLLTYSIEE